MKTARTVSEIGKLIKYYRQKDECENYQRRSYRKKNSGAFKR